MRKRTKTLVAGNAGEEGGPLALRQEEEEDVEQGGGFYACYLLTSLCPRFKGHAYIGFTVNPKRRIRQHNGELRNGAWRTKSKRPWEMVLCIYGFPTHVSALQFEWAWQHPVESLAVRKAAASFKSVSGIPNKIKLAYTMLTLPAWRSFNLTVNFFSTKYQKHTAGCPSLPGHMKVKVCPMDKLPCYQEDDHFLCKGEDKYLIGEEDFDCMILFSDKSASEGLTDFDQMSVHYRNCISSSIQSERLHRMQAIENSDPSYLSYSPPTRRSSVSATAYSDEEETIIDKNKFQATAEICAEVDRQNRKQNTTRGEAISKQTNPYCLMEETLVAFGGGSTSCQLPTAPFSVKGQAVSNGLPVSHEVEVIDILTPPSCRINSYTKKRRVTSGCPQIIDLTKSPTFVQL